MRGEPVTQERLRKLLDYNPYTGQLRWRKRPREDFISLRGERVWNARYAGKPAGTVDPYGYLQVTIDNRHYVGHRLIWCLVHGYFPDQIDHENHDRSANWLQNLKEATDQTNRKNMKLHKSNTSGVVGVTWDKINQKWKAQIGVNNKIKYLGLFDSKEDAIICRLTAESDYGFHPNHGRA